MKVRWGGMTVAEEGSKRSICVPCGMVSVIAFAVCIELARGFPWLCCRLVDVYIYIEMITHGGKQMSE